MNKAKYEELFTAFGKAPMKEFLELLFEGVPPELKKRLLIEEVSYKRYSADIVSLEAWIVIDNLETDKWIWARVERDSTKKTIDEIFKVEFYTKESYAGKHYVPNSIEECFDHYETFFTK